MSPQFSCDVFDISPGKQAKFDDLYIPDLPMLHFAQKVTQNKKYSYHVTYHATPKSLEQFLLFRVCGAALKVAYQPFQSSWFSLSLDVRVKAALFCHRLACEGCKSVSILMALLRSLPA